jgi:CRISPR-associated protein Csd1
MILQALKDYYDRKAADPESDIAPEGFEKKELPFIIVIKATGEFVTLDDTREKAGKKLIAKPYLLPRSKGRSGSKSYATTFLLWDHIGYVLQHPKNDAKAANQHATWMASIESLPSELKQDEGVTAVMAFYKRGGIDLVKASPNWAECSKIPSCNISFRLAGETTPVPCRPAVRQYQKNTMGITPPEDSSDDDAPELFGHCLVTGTYGQIKRTHGKIPIQKYVPSLVAFQKNAGYDSYGKEQAYNAPISASAEFAYTTALKSLLKSDSSKIQVGDATTVFWSEKMDDAEFEQNFAFFFAPKDDPDQETQAVKSLYKSVQSGVPSTGGNRRFFVLGLLPSKARITVRFWINDTVANMAQKILQHFEDLEIDHGPGEQKTIPLRRLLRSIALQEDDENIPPNLSGETIRAVLTGTPYPQTLFQACIRRIKAEQATKNKLTGKPKPHVSYPRAALLKACLNRSLRLHNPTSEQPITMSLDPTNLNIGYRLGRLFSTLERIQSEASPSLNATIRDKFYGAASGTPVAVFGNLMRLKNHHLAKLENVGRRVNFERLLGDIMGGITDFPAHLTLADQGRFAIGYYHQTQDFFTPKSDKH